MEEFEAATFSYAPPLYSPSRIIVNKRLKMNHETDSYSECIVNFYAYWKKKKLNIMK